MVIPIIAINYNTVAVSSIVISILAGFIVGPIVIMGISSIFIKIEIINKLLSIMLKVLINITEIGSRLPLNQINITTPSVIGIILYYCFILGLNSFVKLKLEKRPKSIQKRALNLASLLKYYIRKYKSKIVSVVLIISLITVFLNLIPKIVTPRNKKILIDGGGSEGSSYNVRRKNFNAIFIR